MEKYLEEIREEQKASWNKSSHQWKQWDELIMDFLKPYGDEIIRKLHLKDTHVVLDVAGGTGEPGLTIASKLTKGRVIITDLADDMLVVAHENAKKRGIENVEFSACDVTELPFDDNTFDAISCRMGFMFFPDMLMAVKEMKRVLKPGGRIAASVWDAPEKNFWITALTKVIHQYMEFDMPPPGGPGMFRCAEPGLMTSLFKQAGLKNIMDKEVSGTLNCYTADTYWSYISTASQTAVGALSLLDNQTREKVKTDVYEAIHQRYPEGKVFVESAALVISGEK